MRIPFTAAVTRLRLCCRTSSTTPLWRLALAFWAFVLACGAARATQDLAGSVAIAATAPVLHASANVSDSVVTITNTSSYPIAAPFTLTVRHISAPGVALAAHSGMDADDNAQLAVPLPQGLLAPGAAVSLPVRFLNPRRLPFTFDGGAAGTPLPDDTSVELTVTVHTYSGDPVQPQGAAAGAGVAIVVDGVQRAVTDAAGQATVRVPATQQWIAARRAPTSTGVAQLALIAGQPNTADIVMTDDGEVYGEATLRFDQVQHMTLPRYPAVLTGRLTRPDGTVLRLADLTSVEFRDLADNTVADLAPWFTVDPDGTIRSLDSNALRLPSLIAASILVTGSDANGTPYRVAVTAVGEGPGPISGTVLRPPSNPQLDLAGITIVARNLLTKTARTTVTDANGNFTLPTLPYGQVRLTATVERDGQHYQALALVGQENAQGQANIPLPLRGAGDVRQGPSYTPVDPAARRVDLTVTGKQGVSRAATTLRVPQGTAAVTVAYDANRGWDPVSANNAWGVRVIDAQSGKQLFNVLRRTGTSRDTDSPWGYDDRTGVIEQEIDVAALAQHGDALLTLEGFEQGYDAITPDGPPTLAASLRLDRGLIIGSFALPEDQPIVENDRRRYSMPADGETNTFQRLAQLAVRLPSGAVVTNVRVDTDLSYETSLPVLSATPGQQIELDGDTIRAPLTFKHDPAALSAMRTAFDDAIWMQYRVTVTAQAADGSELTAERRATAKWPLWHAPAGLARYGMRDPGGDDWVGANTYAWLAAHATQLAPVNDFSGEHGTDLGHATHGRGNEFTMYHFHTFAGADPHSGLSNYHRLVARIRELPLQASADPAQKAVGDAAAAEVKAWVLASRAGIDRIAALPSVLEVNYLRGGPDSAGIGGADWGYKLLTTGKVTVNGTLYNLGTGNWSNHRYRGRAAHFHHVQVRLGVE